MNSKFIPTSPTNPCPSCGDIQGNCRHQDTGEITLCMTAANSSRKGEIVQGGYKVITFTQDGLWAILKPNDEELSNERKQEWEDQKLERQRQARVAKQTQQNRALSASQRHELYSQILDQLTLHPETIKSLKRRGLSDDEIAKSGFTSIRPSQRLNKKFNSRLPGINQDGTSLSVLGNGYLCPIRDFHGQINGFQVRLHNPVDGGRYRWLSTPDNATLRLQPEDENPLPVFHPSGECKGVAICEGTGVKPLLVSQRLNLLTIGSAGIQWLSSPKLLKKYISLAIEKYGNLPINIIPDAGWALNDAVRNSIKKLSDWLTENFPESKIQFLDWNQLTKSQGDIDETDLSIVRTLSQESFFKKYGELFNKSFQKWAKDRVKLTADLKQYEERPSIPQGIQDDCDILLLRARLGGGKTGALINFLTLVNATALLVGYRNSLLKDTIKRSNKAGLNAKHIKDVSEVIQKHHVNFAADSSIKLWGGCADSFQKFDAIKSHHPDYFLVHDEICSILDHLKGGGTLKGRQQAAIEWDVKTINNSQFCIMMDANLSDKDVDFIRKVFPDKRIKVLDSIYHENKQKKFFFIETTKEGQDYNKNPKYLPSKLIEKAKLFDRVLWISDSQESCETADEILTKHGHKHFRLDGKTSHDELSQNFQEEPGHFITTHKLDSLSISPSGESGLSIDVYGYFDVVCFDIYGILSINALTQLSARLRDKDVPVYVSCPEFVNITQDTCPYAINQVERVINQRVEMLLAKALEVETELVDSDFVINMFNEMSTKFSQDEWFLESLKDAKQLKYEHSNLKLCLKTALAQAGHQVIDLVEEVNKSEYEERKAIKEMVKRRDSEKVFNSPDIGWEIAQELAKKDVNYDTKCQIRKARIKHKLPGIENTSSWSADLVHILEVEHPQLVDKRWRLMQLTNDKLAKATFKSGTSYNFEHGFVAKDVWKSSHIKIEALKLLGVGEIIEAGIFSCKDTKLQELVNKYYEDSSWFDVIGIPRAKRGRDLKHVKVMISRFLDYFGLEARQTKRSKDGQRWYTIQPPELKVSVIPSFIYTDNKTLTPDKPETGIDFLPDIDACLARRAEAVISQAFDICLFQLTSKAEERKRQEEDWENHQAELQKLVSVIPSYIYIENKTLTPNKPEIGIDFQPGQIENEKLSGFVSLLGECGDWETIAALTESLESQFKRELWRRLPADERERLVLLKRGYT